jgi:tRNA G18 (ribose-2'-O)-methylase SpoU
MNRCYATHVLCSADSDMIVHRITNAADSRLDDFRKLTDVALRRTTEPARGLYIAESLKVIQRALLAGHKPRAVLTQQRWLAELESIFSSMDVSIFLVSDEVAEAVTGYEIHRGALAAMQRPELPALKELIDAASTVLILEDIVDHTNVGAAFRAAAGLGVDAVLVTERCADPLYRRSVRVSMGTVFQIPWTRLGSWDAAASVLHDAGFEIAALALDPAAVSLETFAAARPEKLAIVLGTEGDGITGRALASADQLVTIPMAGGVDSLNVASAAAVALWALQYPPKYSR